MANISGNLDRTIRHAMHDNAAYEELATLLNWASNAKAGTVVIKTLPTSDPNVAGALYANTRVVTVSAT